MEANEGNASHISNGSDTAHEFGYMILDKWGLCDIWNSVLHKSNGLDTTQEFEDILSEK